jgi:protein-tyrosine phosphatase
VRDLGGLAAPTGSTKSGVLVRASSLGDLSATGLESMHGHGIQSVIDIRSPDEVAERPSPYAQGTAYHPAHFVLGRTMQIDQAAVAGTMSTELARLAGAQSGLADVIRAIARAEPGIVLHCVAGRDRTGFVVAILLAALGVSDDDIVADYVASDVELAAEYQRFIAEHAEDEVNIRGAIARRAETMRTVLAGLRAGYGDGAAYLRTAGVDGKDIDRLRAKLLA